MNKLNTIGGVEKAGYGAKVERRPTVDTVHVEMQEVKMNFITIKAAIN